MRSWEGLPNEEFTHQEQYPTTTHCCKCGKESRFAFTMCEDDPNVAFYHDNGKDNKFWPHDCISVSIYFCVDVNCATATALWNQM